MTILYIILTCPQYAQTRQRWQKDTWLKDVDYVYLQDGEEGYLNVAKKYVAWIKSNDLKHDWYFFCDDDTFVFTQRLKEFLQPTDLHIMIGYKGGTFTHEGVKIEWCSGGAGIAVSRQLLQAAKDNDNYFITTESDTSLAIWCKLAASDMVVLDRKDLFCPQQPRPYKGGISYHYCGENDFRNLGGLV